jgi:hypothetical protein
VLPRVHTVQAHMSNSQLHRPQLLKLPQLSLHHMLQWVLPKPARYLQKVEPTLQKLRSHQWPLQ